MNGNFQLADGKMVRLKTGLPKPHRKPCMDQRRVLACVLFFKRNSLCWVQRFQSRRLSTGLRGNILAVQRQ